MVPKPQNNNFAQDKEIPMSRTNIVISGMSGLYPNSKSVKEFSNLLYEQKNPVTSESCRWEFKHPEVSDFSGKLPAVDRFDAQFFKVHYRQAKIMDPMARMILEQSYQAIYDAGLNPKNIKNKKVGVFLSSALAENENFASVDINSVSGFGITGSSKTMFANRVSYWLDVKGPSLAYDLDCSGSFEALHQACSAMQRGECEAAIVGGVNLCLLPHTMINAKRCYALAPDGKAKCFDENADGCTKSEAIGVLFLQKANDALRVYGEVVHVKTEFISRLSCETGQVFGFYREPNTTADFLKQFYKEAQVSPQAVEYVEAFGSATPEADKAELQAIEEVFCENRSDSLLVGSVTSNVGLTDAASGVTALTKVLLGYHNGKIAGNLHYDTPRRDITGIREGRIQIVKEPQMTKYGYVAVNGMSVTGLNSHALLRGHFEPKDLSRYKSSFPRLVTITARQEQYIDAIFEDLKARPIDPEELALLYNIHSSSITGHLGRGYIILDTDEHKKTKILNQVSEYKDDMQRPLWFVYSGMGSQWTGMGTHLMRIPIFAAAIQRCDKVLKTKGINIVDILTSNDKTVYDNVLHSFLGIAAVQIGLTDVLTAIGITPDKIIGHSVGELGCAYADGCITAEEMILSAYARGAVSNDCIKTRGAMAAVGLGYNQIVSQCPPEIDIACHNSSESCTISGPELVIREFIAKLSAAGVFAKEVPCANIAYHSRYIAEAGKFLQEQMKQIIKVPKLRGDKWLSTSVPQEKWNETANKYCSADYMTNNLLNSVLFEETSKLVPSNAVLVEIAPHGLLQAILKRSLSSCTNIALTKRGHSDNATFLLDAIGKLFVEGFYPNVQALYPTVEFPVSTGTPHLSHHVQWMHEEIWPLGCEYERHNAKKSASSKFRITIHDDEYNYLKGNSIHGHILYPFAGALVAVWDTFLMSLELSKKQFSVQFRDIHLYTQPILEDQQLVELDVSLQRISGQFEVLNGKSRVASGFILLSEQPDSREEIRSNQIYEPLNIGSAEIYQKLSTQGYSYSNDFQSIYAVNDELTKAQIHWKDNWVTLLDGLLQLNVLKQNHSNVSKPTQIRDITIDVAEHKHHLIKMSSDVTIIDAEVDDVFDTTTCGGIVIQNIQFENESPKILDRLSFKLYSPPDFARDINHNVNKETEVIFDGTTSKGNAMALKLDGINNLDSLHWEEVPESTKTTIKIKVHFAGVNTRHLNRTTGIISPRSQDEFYGSDFSGITEKNGDRIMGLLKEGTISTVLDAMPEMSWPVPKHWSLEDAATVPLAYAQAFYCLFIKCDLRGHHTVLIHGGAGDLGQAALSIALALGCTVFTTVSDKAKKRFLLKMFPQLKEDHIVSSRNNCFSDMVLNATSGRGCDLVLSCVKGNLKTECLKCVAFSGVVIDTSQIEYREKFEYGMFNMTRSRSYKTVDLGTLFNPRNASELKKIHNLITEGISRGWVRPLSRVTYAAHEVSRAFHLLATNQHRGRVLLRFTQTINPIQARITCTADNSHLILWDGDSFGLQFVEKLISRGATNILIHCMNRSAYYQLRLRSWNNLGANVQIVFDKLANFNDIAATIAKAQEMGPLQGIYIGTKTNFVKEVSTILNRSEKSITELCPTLKYSAIIAVYDKIDNKANISFIKNRFPLTVVSLPDIVKVNSELSTVVDEYTWITAAMDATEQAICSGHPVVNMRPELIQPTNVTQQVARILGTDHARAFINDNQTLEELKVQPVVLETIRKCLERTIHVSLTDNDLITLNKNEINNMESRVKYNSFKEEKGLKALYSYVDSDELRSTVDVVVMDTLVADTVAMGQELDVDATYLIMLPGLEGHHERFRGLCQRLKISALVLQPGLDHLDETPEQLAWRYSKVLLNKMGIKNRFIVLGYESGVEVALKLTAILEGKGLMGIVFCIGDDPEHFREHIKEILKDYPSEEALRLGVVQHIFSLMSGGRTVEEVSLKGQTWDQRVDILRRQFKCVSQSAQYVRAIINAAYSRLVAFRAHGPTSPRALQSQIIWLRTSSKPSQVPAAFKNYSSPQLVVYDLAVPFGQAAKDLRCASIINRHLPEDILDTFNNSNMCTLYTNNEVRFSVHN